MGQEWGRKDQGRHLEDVSEQSFGGEIVRNISFGLREGAEKQLKYHFHQCTIRSTEHRSRLTLVSKEPWGKRAVESVQVGTYSPLPGTTKAAEIKTEDWGVADQLKAWWSEMDSFWRCSAHNMGKGVVLGNSTDPSDFGSMGCQNPESTKNRAKATVDDFRCTKQWAAAGSETLIPWSGIKAWSPGWKPGLLTDRSQGPVARI